MRLIEESIAELEEYSRVPIKFEIRSRLRLDELQRGEFVEKPIAARWKDYDAFDGERPSDWRSRFDLTKWGVLAAYGSMAGTAMETTAETPVLRLGGAIVARDTPQFDMLRGRSDLAVLADLRVHPNARGNGVGRALFLASLDWARAHGCVELHVETQDTNVAACRFYSAMGCALESIDPDGYGADFDEAKLIWRISL
jgi:GNAT superfamily N-acetyltransferase